MRPSGSWAKDEYANGPGTSVFVVGQVFPLSRLRDTVPFVRAGPTGREQRMYVLAESAGSLTVIMLPLQLTDGSCLCSWRGDHVRP